MTHGDKAKAKKAASKASGSKKSSKAVQVSKAAKSSKSTKSGKESGGKKAVEARAKAAKGGKAVEIPQKQSAGAKAAAVPKVSAGKSSPVKASPEKGGANGKPAPRGAVAEVGFSNPVVAAAFRRAVKKFPNAFRRLTD